MAASAPEVRQDLELHTRNGALSSLAGNMTTAQTNASAPWTAIPTRRNGSSSTHTNGYSTRASNASGQQTTKRMHQRRKANMAVYLLLHSTRKRPEKFRAAIIKPQPKI